MRQLQRRIVFSLFQENYRFPAHAGRPRQLFLSNVEFGS